MAAKKMLPGPSTTKSVLHAAKWLIPLLAAGARWLSAHPEVWDGIREQGAKLQKIATDRPDGVWADEIEPGSALAADDSPAS